MSARATGFLLFQITGRNLQGAADSPVVAADIFFQNVQPSCDVGKAVVGRAFGRRRQMAVAFGRGGIQNLLGFGAQILGHLFDLFGIEAM